MGKVQTGTLVQRSAHYHYDVSRRLGGGRRAAEWLDGRAVRREAENRKGERCTVIGLDPGRLAADPVRSGVLPCHLPSQSHHNPNLPSALAGRLHHAESQLHHEVYHGITRCYSWLRTQRERLERLEDAINLPLSFSERPNVQFEKNELIARAMPPFRPILRFLRLCNASQPFLSPDAVAMQRNKCPSRIAFQNPSRR